jgi:hypothetical protein
VDCNLVDVVAPQASSGLTESAAVVAAAMNRNERLENDTWTRAMRLSPFDER